MKSYFGMAQHALVTIAIADRITIPSSGVTLADFRAIFVLTGRHFYICEILWDVYKELVTTYLTRKFELSKWILSLLLCQRGISCLLLSGVTLAVLHNFSYPHSYSVVRLYFVLDIDVPDSWGCSCKISLEWDQFLIIDLIIHEAKSVPLCRCYLGLQILA